MSGGVYAFEPLPWLAKERTRKFGRGVVINNIGLSRSAGVAVLRMPVVGGMLVTGCSTISSAASATYPDHQEIHGPVSTLDGAYPAVVGLVKSDAQGREEAVL